MRFATMTRYVALRASVFAGTGAGPGPGRAARGLRIIPR